MLIFAACMLLAGESVYAQSSPPGEEKYWTYRERLRNEYMTGIGPGMGMSLPAGVRDTVGGTLQWTDCTMALGEYLGVLATEYRILEGRGADTEATVEELFYALWAFNRLDYNAEPFFGGTPSLNGFFMRDDICMDSLDMPAVLQHLNQGLAEPKITTLDSDYMDEIARNNEESLDQAITLITGLALVRRCVPEEVVYSSDGGVQAFQDFETSLSLEAGHIINRIVNYMKEGNFVTVTPDPGDPNLYGIQGEAWDFLIKNPVTGQEVLRGPNAFFLSKGYTSAKYHLNGLLSESTDTLAMAQADTVFKAFEELVLPNDQDFKVMNLNAMANYWPQGLQPDTAFTDHNARVLGPRAFDQSYEWIPMLHQMVFGGENNYLLSAVPPDTLFYNDPAGYYANLLDLAPIEGPYNYGGGNYPEWEWSSTSRTIQPERRGEQNNAFPGNYPGLGYMLYHNLYTLLFDDTVTVPEEEAEQARIYPNPFTTVFVIEVPGGDGFGYTLCDIQGRPLLSGRAAGTVPLRVDARAIPAGMYILNIIYDNGSTGSRKLIKQKH
jgi:hypothetical protein